MVKTGKEETRQTREIPVRGVFSFLKADGYTMKKIKVGIAGLGRLGKVHARNLAFKIPNAQLQAACSLVPAELEYARKELGVSQLYGDYKEMLEKADIDAVVIVTTSTEHCWKARLYR